MTEKQQHSSESGATKESFNEDIEARQEQLEAHKLNALEAEKDFNNKDVGKLADNAESKAKKAHETDINTDNKVDSGLTVLGVERDLKKQSYTKLLKQVQSKLTPAERGFSSFIHQPAVNTISETTGKTIGRPSGLLGGSICALLGSLGLLYFSQHYGYTYNYSIFFACFIGGFLVGLIAEFIIRLFLPKH